MREARTAPLWLALLALALGACGHARVVSSDAAGGQLALEGDGASAGADARARMAEHCGGPDRYTIVSVDQLAKAPVGGPEAFATPWAPGTGQYVLTYRCTGQAPPPLVTPPPPSPPP